MAITDADLPWLTRATAAAYRKWQPMIDRYHGGVPAGLVAVRMVVESAATDDWRVGKDTATGVLSVTVAQERRFGTPDGARFDSATNVFLACTRYNADTALFLQRYPGIPASLDDAYVFGGQLISAIGSGAAGYLLNRARTTGRRFTYREFDRWVQSIASSLPNRGPWGSQDRALIVYRVHAMQVMAEAARASGAPVVAGAPTIPPPPPALGSFRVPPDVSRAMRIAAGSLDFGPRRGLGVALLAGAAVGGILIIAKR